MALVGDITPGNVADGGDADANADPAARLRRLSHDVKNALHGITVNLEVARTRASRGVADPEALVPFLESAAAQLEVAVRLHKEFAALAFSVAASEHSSEAPDNVAPRTTP